MQEAGYGARLVVKERGSERLGKLGLAHSRGAEEEEGGEGPARVGQPGARAHDRVGDRPHRLGLPLDARGELRRQLQQLLRLGREHPLHRDARPLLKDRRHVALKPEHLTIAAVVAFSYQTRLAATTAAAEPDPTTAHHNLKITPRLGTAKLAASSRWLTSSA